MSLLSRRVDAVVVPTVDQDDAGDANQAADQLEESWSLAEPHQERLHTVECRAYDSKEPVSCY